LVGTEYLASSGDYNALYLFQNLQEWFLSWNNGTLQIYYTL
jgi:hypothetical protein